MKTIDASQNSTSEDEEASNNHEINLESEIHKNNGTNDIITIQSKLALNKQSNDATTTTEKLQIKAEKIVDNYVVVAAEPHESNNAIGDNSFDSDVDTNFIDVGHQAPRNSSSSSRFQFYYNYLNFERIVSPNIEILSQIKQVRKTTQKIKVMGMLKADIHFI